MTDSLSILGRTISHYRVIEKLGGGGMGVVYKAEDTSLHRFVALKFLPAELSTTPRALEQFQREAFAASSVNHPNIYTVYDFDVHDGQQFIVLEFLEGQTLREKISGQPLKIEELLELAIQISEGLDAVHSKGIIHRDIKPSNIFITSYGLAKVTDFGLAKTARIPPSDRITETYGSTASFDGIPSSPTSLAGTISYMSPEQARGEQLDIRTDLFSLGALVYEMATGRQAFEGSTPAIVFNAILNEQPLELTLKRRTYSSEIQRVLRKALEKDRDMRYQTASELCIDLRRIKRDVDSERYRRIVGDKSFETSPTSQTKRSRKTMDLLAVLPFVNEKADPQLEYLSDGITETLIGLLSQIPRLRIMASSTVFRYKSRALDPLGVGQILKVRAVLSGQVIQRNDSLIIKAELVDVQDGARLWGEDYCRSMAEVLNVQETIAKEIAQKLQIHLTREEKSRLSKHYTKNVEAYHLYIKGRFHWNKRTEAGWRKGIEFFRKAIETDPKYALGYAGLADCFNVLGGYRVMPPHEAFVQGKATATKAIALDGRLAEAHTSLALATLFYDWNWTEAEKEFQIAIQLNRNNATCHQWYAEYLMALGRPSECLAEVRRAQELDPLSLGINSHVGWGLYFARRFDEASEQLRRTLELDASYTLAHFILGQSYLQSREYAQAITELQAASSLSGRLPSVISSLGYAFGVNGESTRANEVLNELNSRMNTSFVSAYDLALVHIGLEQNEGAFKWLAEALNERASWLIWLNVEPMLDPLRSDPRFQNLVKAVGLPG